MTARALEGASIFPLFKVDVPTPCQPAGELVREITLEVGDQVVTCYTRDPLVDQIDLRGAQVIYQSGPFPAREVGL